MQFNPAAKIWQACAKEPGRYAMQHVMFLRMCDSTGGPALLATNGRMLSIIEVDADPLDVDGLISKDTLRYAAERGGSVRLVEKVAEVIDNKRGRVLASFPRPEGEFPNVPAVVPAADPNRIRTMLSLKYLRDLAETFGAEGIAIELCNGMVPQRITPIGNDGRSVGALMPIIDL